MKPCWVPVVFRRKQISLFVSKLIKIVHFLWKHNLPINELYPALLHFLAFDLEEPIAKQYLENCSKNATYDGHVTADSLISALKKFIKKETDAKLRNASDVVIFADEATSVARKEMMGIFLSCYNEDGWEFVMEYLALLEVSSTKSAFLLDKLVKILKEGENRPTKNYILLLRRDKFNVGRNIRSSKKNLAPNVCQLQVPQSSYLFQTSHWSVFLAGKIWQVAPRTLEIVSLCCFKSLDPNWNSENIWKDFIWLRLLPQGGYHMVPHSKGMRRF